MDRPTSFLFFGLMFGILACVLYIFTNIIITTIVIIIYLTILFKTINKEFYYIIICYSLLGVLTFNFYFNYNLPRNYIEGRIIEDKGYYSISEYGGRKVKVFYGGGKFEVGKKYKLYGEFKKIPIYEKGILGNFEAKVVLNKQKDFISSIYNLKSELFSEFNRKLGKYSASILMGVCYGDNNYLSYDDMEEFNTLGISHVISVSGLHTSLIYGALKTIVGYKVSLIFLFFYVVFTGAEAATVRAFIMIVILVLAPKLRKNYDGVSSLAFSAFILLLIKPYYLLDVGYCLSFLGMLGIYLFYKKLQRNLYKLPGLINDSVSLTIAASAFTVPYIMFIFKSYSIAGILSNLIIIPFYTFIVVLGNMALLAYKIKPLFNILTTMLSSLFLIVNTAQDFILNIIPPPFLFSYMDGLALLMLYPTYILIKRGYRSLIYLPLALLAVIIVSNYKFFPEVRFINAGQYNIITINYKYESFLIAPEKVKLSRIYEKVFVDKIYDEFNEEEEISIDDNYKIHVKKNGRELLLMFIDKDKKIVFIQDEIDSYNNNNSTEKNNEVISESRTKGVSANYKKQNTENNLSYRSDDFPYAIIRVEKDKSKNLKGHFYKSYTIIMGKALEGYIH